MYVVCDNTLPLSEGFVFNRSLTDSVLRAMCYRPRCNSFNVYLCTRAIDPKHYVYQCTFNEKQLAALKEKYYHIKP